MLAQMKQAKVTLVVAKDKVKSARVLARRIKNIENQKEKDKLKQNLLNFFEEVVTMETITENAKIAEASLKGFNHNPKIIDNSISRSSEQVNLPSSETVALDIVGGLDMDDIFNTMETIVSNREEDIEAMFDETDFTNTEDVLKLQQAMNLWSFTMGLVSSMAKTISDMMKATLQKI